MSPPRWHNDHDQLAIVAAYLHRMRVEGYPELVEAGRMKPEVAARGLRITGAIAAMWKAIASVEPEPVWITSAAQGGAWDWERRETLESLAIIRRTMADADPGNSELVGIADAVDTLLWWEKQRFSARWFVDTTIALRAQARAGALPPLALGMAA